MSRNGKKMPVGFATHIIAGGIAGACEAVSTTVLLNVFLIWSLAVGLSASRYHKGPNAALEVRTNTGSMSDYYDHAMTPLNLKI